MKDYADRFQHAPILNVLHCLKELVQDLTIPAADPGVPFIARKGQQEVDVHRSCEGGPKGTEGANGGGEGCEGASNQGLSRDGEAEGGESAEGGGGGCEGAGNQGLTQEGEPECGEGSDGGGEGNQGLSREGEPEGVTRCDRVGNPETQEGEPEDGEGAIEGGDDGCEGKAHQGEGEGELRDGEPEGGEGAGDGEEGLFGEGSVDMGMHGQDLPLRERVEEGVGKGGARRAGGGEGGGGVYSHGAVSQPSVRDPDGAVGGEEQQGAGGKPLEVGAKRKAAEDLQRGKLSKSQKAAAMKFCLKALYVTMPKDLIGTEVILSSPQPGTGVLMGYGGIVSDATAEYGVDVQIVLIDPHSVHYEWGELEGALKRGRFNRQWRRLPKQ